MGLFTIKSSEGRELERQAGVFRRGGSLNGQKQAAFKSQHAVEADNAKARRVAHADSKARNGGL